VGIRVKTMVDIRRIVDLYDLHKSYRRVARELKISRNTVKKYVLKVKDVQRGLAMRSFPKPRNHSAVASCSQNLFARRSMSISNQI